LGALLSDYVIDLTPQEMITQTHTQELHLNFDTINPEFFGFDSLFIEWNTFELLIVVY